MTTRRPVYVCGYPRSGTTLLRSTLSSHSLISLAQSPELVLAMHRAGYGVEDSVAVDDRPSLFEELRRLSPTRRHLGRLDPRLVDEVMSDPRPLPFWELVERLVKPADGTPVWGEKTHNGLFFTPEIFARYPSALIIHLVRDPRSIALSHHRKTTNIERDAEVTMASDLPERPGRGEFLHFATHAMRWAAWMEVADRARRDAPADGWFELRFEDFVADPDREARSLCEAIGVPWEPEMLAPEGRSEDVIHASDSAYAHPRIGTEIDAARGTAHAELPTELDRTVVMHAGEQMRRHGYETAARERSLLGRVRAELENLRLRGELRKDLDRHLRARRPEPARRRPVPPATPAAA